MHTVFLLLSGCLGARQLSNHPLEDKTVFVAAGIPDAPFADFNMTVFDRVGHESPGFDRRPHPRDLPPISIGGAEYDEEPRRTPAHTLIDSVLAGWDMSDQIIQMARALGAQHLRFRPVDAPEGADYTLRFDVHDYGIGADSWQTTVYFEVSATIQLIHNPSGRPIWREEVHDITTVTEALLQAGRPLERTESPARLAEHTYEEMADLLSGLARYGAGILTLPLREAYRHTVEKETARVVE